MARVKDEYCNFAVAQADVDNATLNFTELMTGISLGQGTGIIIDAIEYNISESAIEDMDADGDFVKFAWTVSNTITSLSLDQKQVIHAGRLHRVDAGAAANAIFVEQPMKFDFLPPIIVAAPRLYLASYGGGAVAAGIVRSRLHFRYVDLTTAEYLELAETFVLVG